MKKNEVRMRRILCAVIMVFAFCAGAGFAVRDGIGSVEAKQAVKLAKSQVRMVKGEKMRLQLRGAKGKVVWKSKDKTVASVDKNGIVKAKKSGKTKISAAYGKKSYLCTVWVEAPKINKKSILLQVGAKAQLKISGTKQKVSWSCGKKGVVSVNQKGVVTAKKAGTATVAAKIGTKKYQCKVTVKAKDDRKPAGNTENKMPEEGSGNKKPIEDGSQENSVKVWIEEGTLLFAGQASVTVMIENHGKKPVQIPNGYTLYQKQEGKWGLAPVNYAFSDGTETLEPGNTLKRVCHLVDGELKCQPGEYRICIGTLYIDFQIAENEGSAEGLEMRIKEGNIIPEGQPTVTVQIENHSALPKDMPRNLDMYMEKDGKWDIYSSPIVTDDMICIHPGETLEVAYPLWKNGQNCLPGKYCIKKHIDGKEVLEAEFEIVPRKEPVQDLKVWIKEGEAIPFSQKYITIAVENPSDVMKWTDYGYSIWMKQGDEWLPVPMNIDFPDVMVGIKPGETREIKCSLEGEELNGKLQPGEYHVVIDSHVDAYFKILEATDPTEQYRIEKVN